MDKNIQHQRILSKSRALETDDVKLQTDNGEDSDADKLQTYRIIMMSAMAVASFLLFIPFLPSCRTTAQSESENTTLICKGRSIQFLNCFAGGIILSLTLCHILPESLDAYKQFKASNEPYLCANFPYIQVLVVVGFLFLLLLDQVLFKPAGLDLHSLSSGPPPQKLL